MIAQNSASIRQFVKSDLSIIKNLIYSTIDMCYGDVYTQEAIHFFKNFHAPEKILDDANRGFTLVMMRQGQIMGTGTLIADRVYRVFVLPGFQKCGYGKKIMTLLEGMARLYGFEKVMLESSLVSKRFYEDLGYETIHKSFIQLPKGKRLDYLEMQKSLNKGQHLGP
jgi:GNAT superfamily N-acetyltransferase